MNYREYTPHPSLMPFVKCYWALAIGSPGELMHCKPYLADGLEICINLGDAFTITSGLSVFKSDKGICLTGPMTRPMKVAPSGRLHILGICFRPGGAYYFFLHSAKELVNLCGSMEDLLGAEFQHQIEQISEELRTTEARIKEIDNILITRLGNKSRHLDLRILKALQSIDLSSGRIAVDQLSNLTGMSNRQLQRLFKERIGITPKQLCRNLRFKHLFNTLIQCPSDHRASIALACGYYDQSHMINEFKHYTGMSPAGYFATSIKTPAVCLF